MKNRKLWAVVPAALLVLSVGATTAFAADPTATPAASTAVDAAAPAPLEWMGRGMRHGMDKGALGDMPLRGDMPGGRSELLANALGITADELDTAQQAAAAAALQQAVADGYITEAQAEQWGDSTRAGLYVLREWYDDAAAEGFLADALGISVTELQTARDNMLTAGVEAGLIAQEDANLMQAGQLIADAIQTAKTGAIAQAVEQGLLTQEQADAMTSKGAHGFGDFGDWGMTGDRGPGGMRGFGDLDGSGNAGVPGARGGGRR